MGIVVVLIVVVVGQSFVSIPQLFAQPTYYAQFKDAGGIKPVSYTHLTLPTTPYV